MAQSDFDPDRVPVRIGTWGKPVMRFRWTPFWRRFVWHEGVESRWLWVGDALLLLYDATAYKLHRDYVDRIERETGTAAGSLNEEGLLAAMNHLNIRALGFTADDEDAMATAGSPAGDCSNGASPQAQTPAAECR